MFCFLYFQRGRNLFFSVQDVSLEFVFHMRKEKEQLDIIPTNNLAEVIFREKKREWNKGESL